MHFFNELYYVQLPNHSLDTTQIADYSIVRQKVFIFLCFYVCLLNSLNQNPIAFSNQEFDENMKPRVYLTRPDVPKCGIRLIRDECVQVFLCYVKCK